MHGFFGAVNHYQQMWLNYTHIIAPISSDSGKSLFHWTNDMDQALLQQTISFLH